MRSEMRNFKNMIDKIKEKNKKIIICGEGGVGKKTFIRCYIYGKFYSDS